MAEEKWILQFNKPVILGSLYNPGEKAAFTVADAKKILAGDGVTNPEDPNYGKPPAEVVKKLSAAEVAVIEDAGQPIRQDSLLQFDATQYSQDALRKIRKVLEEERIA